MTILPNTKLIFLYCHFRKIICQQIRIIWFVLFITGLFTTSWYRFQSDSKNILSWSHFKILSDMQMKQTMEGNLNGTLDYETFKWISSLHNSEICGSCCFLAGIGIKYRISRDLIGKLVGRFTSWCLGRFEDFYRG